MDNPINSVDKSTPYPGTGAVKPLHQSEREKERSFSDTLEETLEEEQEQKKKSKHDSVTLGQDSSKKPESADDQWIPSEASTPEPPEKPESEEDPSGRRTCRSEGLRRRISEKWNFHRTH